ncbi:MAG: phenylalanine-4-hydroxylase [Sphingobacteriales bacterium]|jgi:phenylalanine-4-hydroxylase
MSNSTIAFNDFGNKRVKNLPKHLRQYVVDQNYPKYSPIDQSVWRYVMRQNYSYLKDTAYYPYIPGLKAAGLVIDKIPSLQDMNDSLGKIGWGAVTVDGFIPPAAFMEYQAYKVLVIAADIRQVNHIEYTPAPDIIHESAGHAPIIAEKEYADYLSTIGEVGAKAMFSFADYQQYEAIRHLSIVKENPNATKEEIAFAERDLEEKNSNLGDPSEMALLSRLHWWTVEYGLIGTLENPKIYGAGLLSSIGEAYSCMQPNVKKLWYDEETINYSYDITKPQPQLFVTPNFQHLTDILEKFSNKMSFKRGGLYGMNQAIESKGTCTAVLSSGAQVSGVFVVADAHNDDQPYFIRVEGQAQLSYDYKQLPQQGKTTHLNGLSAPVGRIIGFEKPLEDFSETELQRHKIVKGNKVNLLYECGIQLEGVVKSVTRFANGKVGMITFKNCTVTSPNEGVLYSSDETDYDMAVGQKVVSVFYGSADKDAYDEIAYVAKETTVKPVYTDKTRKLLGLYASIRERRDLKVPSLDFRSIFNTLQEEFPEDWLLAMELLELLEMNKNNPELAIEIQEYLISKMDNEKQNQKLIADGLNLIYNTGIEAVVQE